MDGRILVEFCRGGRLSDRYGEATIISASFLIVGVAAGLISAAPTYDLLLILFFLGGIGAAFGEAAMNPLISKLFRREAGSR
jgi:MFS family permease